MSPGCCWKQDRGGDSMLAQGATALLRAARAGDAPFVKLLLEHGALVDLPSKEGITPLMAAAGVDFGSRVTRGRNRTEAGVLETMRLLLDAGADNNARTVTEPRGAGGRGRGGRRGSQVPSALAVPHETALHGAAGRGYTAFVEFLATNGADLTARDANGRTPLDLARGGVNLGGFGAPPPEPFPETAALLESLMTAQGIPVSSPAETSDR
jgi:ankyrin repeat protein